MGELGTYWIEVWADGRWRRILTVRATEEVVLEINDDRETYRIWYQGIHGWVEIARRDPAELVEEIPG